MSFITGTADGTRREPRSKKAGKQGKKGKKKKKTKKKKKKRKMRQEHECWSTKTHLAPVALFGGVVLVLLLANDAHFVASLDETQARIVELETLVAVGE